MDRIGQASEKLHIPAYPLRCYDREGLFPGLTRVNGVRQFSDEGLEALNIIGRLKLAGLEIRNIRRFMERCSRESSTCGQHPALFQKQKTVLAGEIERMQQVLDRLKFKFRYCGEALEAGNEDRLRETTPDGFPEEIRKLCGHGHGKIPEQPGAAEEDRPRRSRTVRVFPGRAPPGRRASGHALREEVLQSTL